MLYTSRYGHATAERHCDFGITRPDWEKVMSGTLSTATFGTGCFWCTEAVFLEVKGVHRVVSGYAGGHTKNPTYQQICTGTTGHAEVIQITFDPAVIAFEDLLEVFWRTHDPTTLNRQGADVGTQYRSVIFYHDDEQRVSAEKSKQETDASGLWKDPIVTEIKSFDTVYTAEGYHQEFYQRNPHQPYCFVIIDPKMKKFRKDMPDMLKTAK
jgi:peptide-methionine (S)-S-oxide reductase